MKNLIIKIAFVLTLVISFWSCNTLQNQSVRETNKIIPEKFSSVSDSTSIVDMNWRNYFNDQNLISLIDSALVNNQELKITLQEIEIRKNEVQARKGEYLPSIGIGAGGGFEKVGEFTRNGAVENQLEIKPGKEFPEPLTDVGFGAVASWEVDIWKKLRNAKKSALNRYLASNEGKNFMITNLVAEIAETYYELMGMDNLLEIINQNIEIQSNALFVAKKQKEAARLNQLAVNRFEAQLLNTQNLQFATKQKIIELENRLNFLTARYPNTITRSSKDFMNADFESTQTGLTSELLSNRPDIKQAEFELEATKLDVKSAKARFFPSFGLRAGVGFQAFNPIYLIKPESLLYNLSGDLIAPLINRNAISAAYKNANAQQIQAVINYEQTILSAYLDVVNQLGRTKNFKESFDSKAKEVDILVNSIDISNKLFNYARADYSEVLLTQREALDAKIELVEIKTKHLKAHVNLFRALGGGWK